jgi:hypothetical protein
VNAKISFRSLSIIVTITRGDRNQLPWSPRVRRVFLAFP